MRRYVPLILLLFGVYACSVQAAPLTFAVTYTEPAVNADGSTLDDLVETQVFYAVDGGAPIAVPSVPATGPTGGQLIEQRILVDLTVGASHIVTAFARAKDTSGNESADSNTDSTTVDFLAPGAPQGTTIRRV